jgi:hypothetical protein
VYRYIKLPDILIFRFKFSYVVIVSVSVLGRLWCQENCCSYYKCCFFCLLMSTISGLLKSIILLVMIDQSQYTIKLAASSTSSGLYP